MNIVVFFYDLPPIIYGMLRTAYLIFYLGMGASH